MIFDPCHSKYEFYSDTRSGFTLIELLVVIAIISLLVSILIPSLQKARDLAKSIACMANLKEISTMIFMYANDWDGTFSLDPADDDYWGSRSHNWWAGHQLCKTFDMKNNEGDNVVGNAAGEFVPPYAYIPLFLCPGTNGRPWWAGGEGSYAVNATATFLDDRPNDPRFPQIPWTIDGKQAPSGRIERIQHPEYCFLYSEVIQNGAVGYNGEVGWAENWDCMPRWPYLSDRHLGCFNVVYWNGACESKNREKFFDYADIHGGIPINFGAGY